MRIESSYCYLLAIFCWLGLPLVSAHAQNYDPPSNYYNSATGTGSTLKNQLQSIMSNGHIERLYGNFRDSAVITDADPNVPGNILTVYDRSSVPGQWDFGNTWDREHIWPQSLQPGSAGNNVGGHLGDPHALRPAIPAINGSRGNDPYGIDNTSGSHRSNGSYYFPGDTDKGDVARSLFYSATRYTGLTLVEGLPGNNEMGDLSSLVAYHYLDPPDEFERRRNHAIYSSSLNPNYYTNNRNAYVDRPEYVWSVFVDQNNDSRLAIGGALVLDDGSSVANLNLGSVLVGAAVPVAQPVAVTKFGADGTYYEVSTSGDATSTLEGRYNAMPVGGFASQTMQVGLSTSTMSAGLRSGQVTIDNLDVTTGRGIDRGANDGNDTIDVSLSVLDHAVPSFLGTSALPTLTLDFGQIQLGSSATDLDFSLFNLEGTAGFTAGLELDAISGSGDTSVLTTDLATFGGGSALAAGASSTFTATFDTATAGLFSASYTLSFSDEDLPGATALGDLSLLLTGEIITAVDHADFNESGLVDGQDLLIWQTGFGNGTTLAAGDANGDELVDAEDLTIWQNQFGTTSSLSANSQAVPEPGALWVALTGLLFASGRRRC